MRRLKIAIVVIVAVLMAGCSQIPSAGKPEVASHTKAVPLSTVLKSSEPTGPLHAFVVPDHRFAAGFAQVTLSDLAKDPKVHFQSVASYEFFKKSFEAHAHREMTDAQFSKFLHSKRVKTEACNLTSIRTAGIDDAGNLGWIDRACTPGEELIYISVGTTWTVVAAMGCLNPIDELVAPSTGILILNEPDVLDPPNPISLPIPTKERPNITSDGGNPPRNHNPWH